MTAVMKRLSYTFFYYTTTSKLGCTDFMTGRLGDLYSGGGRGGEFTTRFRGGPLTVKKHDLLEEEFVT